MTNTYRTLSDVGRHYFGEGDLELNLTADEERDALTNGHLEIVPRTYRVLSDNYEAGKQGEEFERAYPVEIEAGLISGGHIERVDKPEPEPKKTAKKTAKAAEAAESKEK
ncbi:MAG TPA: hypothetical protein VFB74_30745 [Kribbellaceae bacterium]|nr:hypothetical protein [Kribbellaceae bacterium]